MVGSTRPPLPTYDQVAEALPLVLEGDVAEKHLDYNGHVNMRHYVKFAAVSSDRLLRGVGIDDDYRAERRMGSFTAEHHVRYLAELHVGDRWQAHTVWVDRSTKAAHQLSFVLNASSRRLSATVEMMLVHVSMDDRRAEAFPKDVARRIDSRIERTRQIRWPLPLGGAMDVGVSAVGRSEARVETPRAALPRPGWLASSSDLDDAGLPRHARRFGEDRTACGEAATGWRYRWRPAFDPREPVACARCRTIVWSIPGSSSV